MKVNVKSLKHIWSGCKIYPSGRWLFSKLISYSGLIDALVLELFLGEAVVKLTDKGEVRNYLNSIHVIALLNLGELTSGLALNMDLKNLIRGIVTEININYLKKARGILIAKCQFDIPVVTGNMNYWLKTNIYDQENDIVAVARVCWRLALTAENQSAK